MEYRDWGGLGSSLFPQLCAPHLSWARTCHLPSSTHLLPAAANMNLDRIGEQAEAMFGVG